MSSAWKGVRLHTGGAASLRVRIAPAGDGALALTAVDADGAPVLSIDSVVEQPLDASLVAGARAAERRSLFAPEWVEVPAPSLNGWYPRLAVVGELDAGAADVPRHADLGALVAAIDEGGPAPEVVLARAPVTSGGDLAGAARATVADAVELLQGWLREERLSDARLVLVTRGAVAAREGEVPDPAAAAFAGLARSAQSEHPGRLLLVDLDDRADVPWRELLATEEPELAVREGTLHAPRLARVADEPEAPARLGPDGTVLLTGGTGTLGPLIARHLAVEHGVRRLLLVSRRGPEADTAGALEAELSELGCELTVAPCDVADRDQLATLLQSIPAEHPLTAVIHAAAVLDDGLVESLTPEQVDRVMRAKVDGAANLHELTASLELSELVLFSSVGSLFGSPGRGNHAAANAFLDALAQVRRAQGLPAVSLEWGNWDVGITAAVREVLQRAAMEALPPDEGLELLDAARSLDRPVLAPVRLDAAAMRARARGGTLPVLLRGLVRVPARRARDGGGSLTRRLAGLPQREWDAVLLDLVRSEAGTVLGQAADEVEPERTMLELGFDSLGAVELRNRLSQATGLRLPPKLAFDHPTPAAVAAYLRERLADQVGDGAAADHNGAGTLSGLLRHAHEQGSVADALMLLLDASKLRPAFRAAGDLDGVPRAAAISGGGVSPRLICVPTFLVGSGPHQFARFAAGFGGERAVSALALPGFKEGDPLPASWSAAVDALAACVREAAQGEPFVLVGYSGGGALAHAVAEQLEDDGAELAGLVMLDSYALDGEEMGQLVASVVAQMLDRNDDLIDLADDDLLAMGAYMRLFREWEPGSIDSPQLLVRAGKSLRDGSDEAPWLKPATLVEVPGDHFELIESSADATARAVEEWLGEVARPRDMEVTRDG